MTSVTRENTVTEYRAGAPVRRRRRRGGLTALLAILLVLGAILVVADRVAAQAAERELQSQVVQELAARQVAYSSLDVGIGGVPFLTQVARGRYDKITIDMAEVQLPAGEARAATLPDLHVVATGVNADARELAQGTASVVADVVTGTAVVSYQTLQDLIDLSQYRLSNLIFSEENGGLRVEGTASIAGISLPLVAVADVTVVDGVISVRLRDAKAVGVEIPQVARNYLDSLVNQNLTARLPALPFGLALDHLSVAGPGLAITATGHDVPLVS
jgi:LmeA-like phospholipid-binding